MSVRIPNEVERRLSRSLSVTEPLRLTRFFFVFSPSLITSQFSYT